MKKLFIIVFSESKFSKSDLMKFLDTRKEVSYWASNLPTSVLIVSELNAKEVSNMLEKKFGSFTHLVLKVEKNVGEGYFGRLDPNLWKHFEK
jgi:hypothetical protein